MPRAFSSGALSIWSKADASLRFGYLSCRTLVIAAVSVVLPWSMCPMVPMLTCGLVPSNLALATGFLSPWLRRWCVLWGGLWGVGLLARRLGDDLLGHVGRDLGVAVEDHRVAGPTLGAAAQIAHVAEHLRERDQGPDDAGAGALLHRLDDPAPGVQVADDVAHVVLGRDDLDGHQRLEQGRVGLARGLLKDHRAGDLEGHLRGVDLVVLAVDQDGLDTHQWVTGEDAVLHRVLDALVDRGDVLPRDPATGHGVLELVGRAVAADRKRLE